MEFPDYANLANVSWMEQEYLRFRKDPEKVDSSWRHFFEGMELGLFLSSQKGSLSKSFLEKKEPSTFSGIEKASYLELRLALCIDAYRRWGHLGAKISPLEEPFLPKELELERFQLTQEDLKQRVRSFGLLDKEEALVEEVISSLQKIYLGSIGFEYVGIVSLEEEKFLQQKIEARRKKLLPEEKRAIYEELSNAESFEAFLHARYVGQTRFSLEGNETSLLFLQKMIEKASMMGLDEAWIGMAHRGRLNLLCNLLKKPLEELFSYFEEDLCLALFGNDDVKYHMGYFQDLILANEQKFRLGMLPNPSHLESIDPVLLGFVRGRATKKGDLKKEKTVAIMIHGDAALAGQGVVYETMQLSRLKGYEVGGVIHLVLNNQIGYTTSPKDSRSMRYSTDLAKTFGAPVIHLNAEDPESALFVAELSVEWRQRFQKDLFIDLIGYRKYGHNEGDEPFFTQPLEYQKIRSRLSIPALYAKEKIEEGVLTLEESQAIQKEQKERLQKALSQVKTTFPEGLKKDFLFKETKISRAILDRIKEEFCKIPENFSLHPKLIKWVEERASSEKIDWAFAEALALGSLLLENHPVRFAGQDVQRGTFSQRHLVWVDQKNGSFHYPLALGKQELLELINSPLTEFAGMGFEYGYSIADVGMTLWEAQYGDFDNGAQVIIDQYLASGEKKWGFSSSLTLLLPHAFEGAGPEHSSARLERFLQLAAENNFQIAYPTTPANYFHLLRLQSFQKKPLILFTPKSLLRNPLCKSSYQELTEGQFLPLLWDPQAVLEPKKLIFCTGKIFYDLLSLRKATDRCRIVRVERLYPFPKEEVIQQIQSAQAESYLWVQEEPKNMGAWEWIEREISPLLPEGKKLEYVGRKKDATVATGSHTQHKIEQKAILDEALQ